MAQEDGALTDAHDTAAIADDGRRLLKSSLLLFGMVLFAYNASIVLHELGHAAAMWATGMNIQRIVVDPFGRSCCVASSPMVWPAVVFWSGAVLGSLAGLLLAGLAWRLRPTFAILCMMVGAISCIDNGITLIHPLVMPASWGDTTYLIAIGTSWTVVLAVGSLLVVAGLLVLTASLPLVGIRSSDGIRVRVAVFAVGILPYVVARFVATLLHGGVTFHGWLLYSVKVGGCILVGALLTNIAQRRIPSPKTRATGGITWLRVAAVNVAGLVLVSALLAAFLRNPFLECTPNPKVDYVVQINDLCKAGREEELNAWPYYKRAVSLYVERPGDVDFRICRCWPWDLTVGERRVLKKWVEANSKALAQLQAGARRPYYWRTWRQKSPWLIPLSRPEAIRDLVYALVVRAKFSVIEGRAPEAMDDLLTCLRLAGHLERSPMLIDQFAGTHDMAVGVRNALLVVHKTSVDTELLEQLQVQLERFAEERPEGIDLRVAKLKILDVIQRVYTDNGKGNGRIFLPSAVVQLSEFWKGATEEDWTSFAGFTRRQTTEAVERGFEYMSSILEKKPFELKEQGIDEWDVWDEFVDRVDGNLLAVTLAPEFPRILELAAHCNAQTDALITGVALLRYKADYGRFPSELKMLARQGYLKELPIDPYSGRPLVYRRSGDDFILYSFGADFDDDGGRPSYWGEGEKGGDQVFWPLQHQTREFRIETEQ
ncbi:MAG: M50 family metallopeptidase [Phycisphaerales bacterium]|nr:MAG: M50 family metallopeptidase [Phycisphaerales bacterium]